MKRSELYAKVWATPVLKIAAEVGITGTRIAAICRQHGIPTPPRGYWAKLSAGKQPPTVPLPSPEADYEIKVGAPQGRPKPSAWVAPGLLLRPAVEALVDPEPEAASDDDHLEPCVREARPKIQRVPARPAGPSLPPSAVQVDLELVRAAAAELQGMQAIRELLQAIAARAVHAPADDAQRILAWAAAVREKLEAHDPVAALLRLAAEQSQGQSRGP
ncbi:hypothetical protein CDN99_26090 [Roseateles aquatilis]|uniref:Uncharacterized protein n=1 Tax=Roseateles aquatilis TaxID=431061 RepID=A0A246ITQ2_9BURK|nr:hypothetical protein [Roseateles aquatilis]OWQ83603.1 hypothetical protein CDN99_26090 [Roseateles aquatilis]